MTSGATPSVASGGQPEFIGRYRIIEPIGRGAMGTVYAALDEQLDRAVAVKLLLTDLEAEPEIRERFFREAKVTSQLTHRNIVTIYDLGDDRGRPYIVMEQLRGLPLADYLQASRAPTLDSKIDLMIQTCEGLQSAHHQGVIHRDVKPSNLFVQEDGTVRILDFGIARLAASNLTASGLLIGTPEYMSPEQAQGRPVDARSDIFSAAAVFYFILSGRSAFGSTDLRKVLQAILRDDPPALTDAEAPEAVRRVLAKGLAKSPADRYHQCADLSADLDRARRSYNSATLRIIEAALGRYRQALALIDEQRALARALGATGADEAADDAVRQLAERFPLFATHSDLTTLMDLIDRGAASAALERLQLHHNEQQAALAALQAQAKADAGAQPAPRDARSWKARAAALWRGHS